MFCKQCGKTLPDGAQFCTGCGAQLGGTANENTEFLEVKPASASLGMKTRLGISVGLAGAAVYFLGLFGGYLALIVAVGYVLLMEDNTWLRKTAVKAAVIMFSFSLLGLLLGFLPDATGIIGQFVTLFKGDRSDLNSVDSIVSILRIILSVIEKIAMLILGIKALWQNSIAIKPIDNIVENHMSNT